LSGYKGVCGVLDTDPDVSAHSYQLGNLVSSASSTIESTIGSRFPLPDKPGSSVHRYEYGKVVCIFMACVYVYVIILTLVGPEHLRRKFDVEHDDDVRYVANEKSIAAAMRRKERGSGEEEAVKAEEKVGTEHRA
jgi:MFS transporter, SHS family, lactate transporter